MRFLAAESRRERWIIKTSKEAMHLSCAESICARTVDLQELEPWSSRVLSREYPVRVYHGTFFRIGELKLALIIVT